MGRFRAQTKSCIDHNENKKKTQHTLHTDSRKKQRLRYGQRWPAGHCQCKLQSDAEGTRSVLRALSLSLSRARTSLHLYGEWEKGVEALGFVLPCANACLRCAGAVLFITLWPWVEQAGVVGAIAKPACQPAWCIGLLVYHALRRKCPSKSQLKSYGNLKQWLEAHILLLQYVSGREI